MIILHTASVLERLSYQSKVCNKHTDNLEKEEIIFCCDICKDNQIPTIDK